MIDADTLNQLKEVTAKFGWTLSPKEDDPKGDTLVVSNKKAMSVGDLIHKGKGKWKFLQGDLKVWDCNGEVVKFFEGFLQKYFYLSPVKSAKVKVIETVEQMLVTQDLEKSGRYQTNPKEICVEKVHYRDGWYILIWYDYCNPSYKSNMSLRLESPDGKPWEAALIILP